jgi:DNA-binding NarL/FixJ family response regulator
VGWGLFSIRERLTLLGGRFEIHSAPGKGTRVRLVPPRGDAPSSVDPAVSTRSLIGAAAAGENDHGSADALRILIVDDHAAVRSAFRAILNERPQLSVVGEASNGVEAIAREHTLRPDVILIDIAMPQMDGIEATVRIRAELPDIRIFGLSMQPRGAVSHAIELAGAAGFFVKGVDTQRLIQHLLVVHAARGARPRVLLADDHPGVVKALKRMLSFECDVVGVVADGSEVVEAAARLQPVVPVVDVKLPNVNGLEVCPRILQTNPRAKVILITAMIDDRVRADALATGASGFFSKLAPGEELIESIRGMWAECSITAQSVPVEDRP